MPTCTFEVASQEALVVPVIIQNPNSGQELTVDGVLDTGASHTQIQNDIAEELILPRYDSELIDTVNSIIDCDRYLANITLQFREGILIELGELYIIDGLTSCQCLIARDILYNGLLIYNGLDNSFTLSL